MFLYHYLNNKINNKINNNIDYNDDNLDDNLDGDNDLNINSIIDIINRNDNGNDVIKIKCVYDKNDKDVIDYLYITGIYWFQPYKVYDDKYNILNFDKNKIYNNITKIICFYTKSCFTDYSMFPNLKFLYLIGNFYDGELTGINKDIKYIILNRCKYFKTKYIPNLKMLYCLESYANDSKFDITKDYHKYKKDNIDWCQH